MFLLVLVKVQGPTLIFLMDESFSSTTFRGQKKDTCMAMTYEVDLHGHDRRQEMIVTFIYLLCNYSQKYPS